MTHRIGVYLPDEAASPCAGDALDPPARVVLAGMTAAARRSLT
jgi:hypothetical protein